MTASLPSRGTAAFDAYSHTGNRNFILMPIDTLAKRSIAISGIDAAGMAQHSLRAFL